MFQRKRERATPTYSIHRPSNQTVLPPACPLYGIIQPTETEGNGYIELTMDV